MRSVMLSALLYCRSARPIASELPDMASRSRQAFFSARRPALAARQIGNAFDEERSREDLQRLPSIERIGIMSGEELQILRGSFREHLDRSRETAVERKHRAFRNVDEHHALRRTGDDDHPAF